MDSIVDPLAKEALTIAARHAAEVDAAARFPHEAIAALKRESLLSALIPASLGGGDLSLHQVARICHALGQNCASTAMIFAMHQIQVACLVRHGAGSAWQRALLRRIADEQLLFASATSELGTGGNILASICAPEDDGACIRLEKNATAISYGAAADGIIVTCRRGPDSAANDQISIALRREDYTLERTTAWNTLGMRGTCTDGFILRAGCHRAHIAPEPFSGIAAQTMLPVSHLLWCSVWLGIATDALLRARDFLRQAARKGGSGGASGRLAAAAGLLQMLQARLRAALEGFDAADAEGLAADMRQTAAMNMLKVSISEGAVQVVQHALAICGLAGYRNDTPFSVGRHMRDLLSAPLMIGNDRIAENTTNLLLLRQPELGIG